MKRLLEPTPAAKPAPGPVISKLVVSRGASVALALVLFVACGGEKSGTADTRDETASGDVTAEKAGPLVVGHLALKGFKTQDWAALVKLAPPRGANEKGLAEYYERNYRTWRKGSVEQWDGAAPDQLRFHESDPRRAYLRYTTRGEMSYSVGLLREDDLWYFRKLVKLRTSAFEELPTTSEGASAAL